MSRPESVYPLCRRGHPREERADDARCVRLDSGGVSACSCLGYRPVEVEVDAPIVEDEDPGPPLTGVNISVTPDGGGTMTVGMYVPVDMSTQAGTDELVDALRQVADQMGAFVRANFPRDPREVVPGYETTRLREYPAYEEEPDGAR